MANTLIKFRRGTGNWWNSTGPNGASTPAGIVGYGTTSSANYQVDNISSPTTRTFNQLSITTGEPWVNTITKQLWIDNVVINPAIKLTLNGAAVSSSMTFDGSSYEAQQVFNIETTDQYLKNVNSLEFPIDDETSDVNKVKAFMVSVVGGQASDYTATLNNGEWTVTWGTSNSQTFNAGGDYIGFGWALASGVTTPTFLQIPDTDTKSKNIISSSRNSTVAASSNLTNGNVYLNNIESVGGVDSSSSSVLLNGTNGIGVTYTYNNGTDKVEVGHTNTAITVGTTSASINASNQLTVSKLTYDEYGHITAVSTDTVNLPMGGGGSANTFAVEAETTDSVQPTQGFAQAVIKETHRADTTITGVVGTSGQNTVTYSGTIAAGDTLTYNNRTYTVNSVSGTTVTLNTNLEDSIASGDNVTRNYPVTTDMFKLQQSGLTSSTLSSYSGTKVTFAKATHDSDTASNSDATSTILMNVDVIDGGTFN